MPVTGRATTVQPGSGSLAAMLGQSGVSHDNAAYHGQPPAPRRPATLAAGALAVPGPVPRPHCPRGRDAAGQVRGPVVPPRAGTGPGQGLD